MFRSGGSSEASRQSKYDDASKTCAFGMILLKQGREVVAKIQTRRQKHRAQQRADRISAILQLNRRPDTHRAEGDFTVLQQRYGPRPEYGYDPVSTWKRATSRSQTLLGLDGMGIPGKRVLDIGAGDGMLVVALNAFGHRATAVDQEDWRHDGAQGVRFELADCCKKLPFEDGVFDLACSFNCFEHFPDPASALSDMVRGVKPGGWIYIEFNPLYASPWGLHAYRALRMPYPQFLFSEAFVQEKLREIGIWDLGKKRTELQYLNQWRLDAFDGIWNRDDCSILTRRVMVDESALDLVLDYPEAFCGRDLTFKDVTVGGITIGLKRNACGKTSVQPVSAVNDG